MTKLLLQQYYTINCENIPQQFEKSIWKPENKFGFLLGMIAFGMDTHKTQLNSLLVSGQFEDQENDFIDSMFDYYIRPFHKSYNTDCHTPLTISSRISSRSNSMEDLDYAPEEKEPLHKDLKKAVLKRDVVCLFCWNQKPLEGSHIIAQKNIPMVYDEPSLFIRAEIKHKHQVQNGLLLCKNCHDEFDKLKRYVDVVDDKLVVKVVNETNDDANLDWLKAVRNLKAMRRANEEDWNEIDNRQSVETNGEMALYFVQNNATKLPNRQALEFHKTACHIWRMAGGGEPDEEYCPDNDDEYVVVDYRLKDIQKWMDDSSATMNTEYI